MFSKKPASSSTALKLWLGFLKTCEKRRRLIFGAEGENKVFLQLDKYLETLDIVSIFNRSQIQGPVYKSGAHEMWIHFLL